MPEIFMQFEPKRNLVDILEEKEYMTYKVKLDKFFYIVLFDTILLTSTLEPIRFSRFKRELISFRLT